MTAAVDRIARAGGTPLAISENGVLMGVIHLKDVIKPGVKSASPTFAAWACARS
ncbi:MAG: hypothetical protein WDM92_07730 [Caulobacteraceae bacterium]